MFELRQQEINHLRLSPLNQIAALKLKAAGQSIRGTALPVFQLMTWGVDKGVRLIHKQLRAELHRLSELETPRHAQDYLLQSLPGGLQELQQLLIQASPRIAAECLLDVLDARIKADPNHPYPQG